MGARGSLCENPSGMSAGNLWPPFGPWGFRGVESIRRVDSAPRCPGSAGRAGGHPPHAGGDHDHAARRLPRKLRIPGKRRRKLKHLLGQMDSANFGAAAVDSPLANCKLWISGQLTALGRLCLPPRFVLICICCRVFAGLPLPTINWGESRFSRFFGAFAWMLGL